MFRIPVMKSVKVKNSKRADVLLFDVKYQTLGEAGKARLALIRIANMAHFAPCDSQTGKEEKFIPNPKWSIGEISRC